MADAFRSGLQTTDAEGYADCNPEQNSSTMRSRRGPKTFMDRVSLDPPRQGRVNASHGSTLLLVFINAPVVCVLRSERE